MGPGAATGSQPQGGPGSCGARRGRLRRSGAPRGAARASAGRGGQDALQWPRRSCPGPALQGVPSENPRAARRRGCLSASAQQTRSSVPSPGSEAEDRSRCLCAGGPSGSLCQRLGRNKRNKGQPYFEGS